MASGANIIIQIPTTQAMQEHIFVQDTIHPLNCAMSVVPTMLLPLPLPTLLWTSKSKFTNTTFFLPHGCENEIHT